MMNILATVAISTLASFAVVNGADATNPAIYNANSYYEQYGTIINAYYDTNNGNDFAIDWVRADGNVFSWYPDDEDVRNLHVGKVIDVAYYNNGTPNDVTDDYPVYMTYDNDRIVYSYDWNYYYHWSYSSIYDWYWSYNY